MNKAVCFINVSLVLAVLIGSTGCSERSVLDLTNADVVVIETNLQKAPSYLVSYDKNGDQLHSISLNCSGLNSNWSANAPIVNSTAYFNTRNTNSSSEKVVAFHLDTGEIETFDDINPWMLSAIGNETYIFGMNTISGKGGFGATIGRYNLQTKQRDQIDIDYPGRCLAYDNHNLYVVCEPKSSERATNSASKLIVVNPDTAQTTKTISLPECGEITSCFVSEGLVYLPPINKVAGNYVEADKNTKVFVVDPQSESIDTIDTGVVAPQYIQEYHDCLLILNDPGNGADFQDQPHEHHITMVNKRTHEILNDYKFDYTPAAIQVSGDELYVSSNRSYVNRAEDQCMYIYSLPEFELKRSFVITPKHGADFYLTTGFCTISANH